MKRSIKITALVIVFLLVVLFIKFKSNYGFIVKYKEGNIISYVFSYNKTEQYLETLQSCYDESYRYDKDRDITVTKVKYKTRALLDKLDLSYEKGNLCDSEFILGETFISEFLEKAKVEEVTLETCSKGKCKTKKIEKDVTKLLKEINKEEYVKENKNITIPESYKTLISVYYDLDKMPNILNIFKVDNYIVLRNTDANDHAKALKYNFNENIEKQINKLTN